MALLFRRGLDQWQNFTFIVETTLAPTVQTYGVAGITSNSATLNGYVEAGDEEVLEQGFEYWCADGDVVTVKCTGEEMSVTITGLESGATYTYRAYAKTESGTTYGSNMEFTTIIAPTVLVYEATDITSESATLHGYVEAAYEEILECGFEYWGANGVVKTVVATEEDMSATLTGLSPYVTYGFRAYAKTESETTRSENMSFTTTPIPPTVQTYEATEITENSALLSGYVEAGTETIRERGFEYWGPDGKVETVTASGNDISATIKGLTEGTAYSYRAYATTTKLGTTYGEEVTFTTLGPVAPTVLTYEATDITGNSATLKGAIRTGDEEILEKGFEYWTGNGDVQTITSTKDYMSETVTGLKLSTTYTYRAYAKTESGTTYGENVSFTTLENTDGVSDVNAGLEEEARYTTDGKKVSQPQRGVNIIRYSDGTAKKVLVK